MKNLRQHLTPESAQRIGFLYEQIRRDFDELVGIVERETRDVQDELVKEEASSLVTFATLMGSEKAKEIFGKR